MHLPICAFGIVLVESKDIKVEIKELERTDGLTTLFMSLNEIISNFDNIITIVNVTLAKVVEVSLQSSNDLSPYDS